MNRDRPRNMTASIYDRLLGIHRETREDFQLLLTRYAGQRLLYRLSQSPHRERFLLKGATLFTLWEGTAHRATRDLDLLGCGDPDAQVISEVFRSLCSCPVEDDGLTFQAESVTGAQVREEEMYQGVRIQMLSLLGNARIPLQIDVGFGDAVTPTAQEAELPTLLDLPRPRLLAYPRETVVAEKCQIMVNLGMRNSRLKDYYDLWYLARHFDFDGRLLNRAVAATFERRRTPIPADPPVALTGEFSGASGRPAQWQAFLRKGGLKDEQAVSLKEVTSYLHGFLMPPLRALAGSVPFDLLWRHEADSWQQAV